MCIEVDMECPYKTQIKKHVFLERKNMKSLFVIIVSLFAFTLVGCGAPTVRYYRNGDYAGHHSECCGGQPEPTAAIYTNVGVKTGVDHTREFYRKRDEQIGTHTIEENRYGRIGGKNGLPAHGVIRQTTVVREERYGTHAAPPILSPIAETISDW